MSILFGKRTLCTIFLKTYISITKLSGIKLIDDPNHQIVDNNYNLSITQAKAILELRLQKANWNGNK